jgi:hypothetical protein
MEINMCEIIEYEVRKLKRERAKTEKLRGILISSIKINSLSLFKKFLTNTIDAIDRYTDEHTTQCNSKKHTLQYITSLCCYFGRSNMIDEICCHFKDIIDLEEIVMKVSLLIQVWQQVLLQLAWIMKI